LSPEEVRKVWKVDDALAGRLTAGKGRNGPGDEIYHLELTGKRMYQLQQYLEEKARNNPDFFDLRMAVLFLEELKKAKPVSELEQPLWPGAGA